MFYVNGLGWITDNNYGSHKGKVNNLETPAKLPNPAKVININYENWRRIDLQSKRTCLAIGLAMMHRNDLDIRKKRNIGIIGYGNNASIESDIHYYEDYLTHNKKGARGNLFTYTLPTIPLSEAAIFYQFQGSISYIHNPRNPLLEAINAAILQLKTSNLEEVFIGTYEQPAVFLTISSKNSSSVCSLNEIDLSKNSQDIIKQINNHIKTGKE